MSQLDLRSGKPSLWVTDLSIHFGRCCECSSSVPASLQLLRLPTSVSSACACQGKPSISKKSRIHSTVHVGNGIGLQPHANFAQPRKASEGNWQRSFGLHAYTGVVWVRVPRGPIKLGGFGMTYAMTVSSSVALPIQRCFTVLVILHR
jgi:hypothetical protein